MTTDLKAMNYILFNNYDYQKPSASKSENRQFFGNGAFFNENHLLSINIHMVKKELCLLKGMSINIKYGSRFKIYLFSTCFLILL